MNTQAVLLHVGHERTRQREIWGDQDYPAVDPVVTTVPELAPLHAAQFYGIPTAAEAKRRTEQAWAEGKCTWAHILIEEVAESIEAAALHATGSGSLGELRNELIQSAAVAVQWAERAHLPAAPSPVTSPPAQENPL